MHKPALIAALAVLLAGSSSGVSAQPIESSTEPSVELSGFRCNGGRVAWSPTAEFVVFDHKERDGGFDLYLTRDFETDVGEPTIRSFVP